MRILAPSHWPGTVALSLAGDAVECIYHDVHCTVADIRVRLSQAGRDISSVLTESHTLLFCLRKSDPRSAAELQSLMQVAMLMLRVF